MSKQAGNSKVEWSPTCEKRIQVTVWSGNYNWDE